MSERESIENRELVKKIIELCQQQASGTIFIATADNHLAKVALIEGEIVCASLHRLNGLDAIRALAGLPSGVFGFNPDLQLVTQKQALPDTDSLLQILQSGVVYSRQYDAASSHQESENLPAKSEIMKVLVEESTEYLGPMASIICQEYFQEFPAPMTLGNIQHVIRQLERDISNAEKAETFRSTVLKRLGQ